MKFEVGKLYRCPEYFLLVFPSKDQLISARALWAADRTVETPLARWQEAAGTQYPEMARAVTAVLSKKLDCRVRCSEPGEIFMLLQQDGDSLHVLFGGIQGWIVYKDWLKIEEFVR